MDVSAIVTLVGWLGMFLLGIHHLTEGIKDLAGDSLRRALTRLVAGRVSAIASGVVFTALIQSSTAAILTVIGFVSAGLMTFVQAIGVIMGATLGTTSTPWMVAYFGFRVRIASFAMPMLGVGALLWLAAKGHARSLGAVIAGFGLLFTGIDYMKNGMKGVTWNFEGFSGPGSMWLLAAIGIGMTIVMQSSSAAAATTLVALNAGALSFEQSCALVVGQSIGTTGTTALVMIGAGLAVRRAALAHILFSAIVGLFGMVFLGPLTAAADWFGSRLDDPDGVLAVAAFSSIFKFAGIAVFFPLMNRFAVFIARITEGGSESAASRLEPTLYDAGGAVALEAGHRAILEIARGAIDAVRRGLAGEPVTYTPPAAAVRRTVEFLESLSLETTDTGTIGPGLVRLAHALDHLERLHEYLARAPAPTQAWQPPPGFGEGARALASWLEATQEPEVVPNAGVVAALKKVSARLSEECRAVRERLLEDVALQRVRAPTARAGLDQLAWADSALHHAAGVARSLHDEAEE